MMAKNSVVRATIDEVIKQQATTVLAAWASQCLTQFEFCSSELRKKSSYHSFR